MKLKKEEQYIDKKLQDIIGLFENRLKSIESNLYDGIAQRVSHEEIAQRAYKLYEQRNYESGNELNDWLTAEKELNRRLLIAEVIEQISEIIKPIKKLDIDQNEIDNMDIKLILTKIHQWLEIEKKLRFEHFEKVRLKLQYEQEENMKRKKPDLEKEIIQKVILKTYYDSLPNIDDVTNVSHPDIKKAEEFTKSILDIKPSGNVAHRDTACHVLHKLLGNQDQPCLFYDSANGISLHDASGNLVDMDCDDKPFVLKLHSSEGLGDDKSKKTDIDEIKVAETLNYAIEKNESHPMIDDIRDRLAKVHDVDKNSIIIKHVFAGTFNIVYTVINLARTTIDRLRSISERLRTQFNQYVSAKIHPLLYRPSFDVSYFDARGNKTFGSQSETHQVGPPGHTKTYTTASGWTRYGLKVLGKYGNDDWLHPFGHAGNWYRAFHGTGNAQQQDFNGSTAYSDASAACVDALSSIFEGGFRLARVTAYGPGIYCSPNPNWLGPSSFVGTVSLDTQQGPKNFKCMLQVAVNPNGVNCASGDIWVARTPQDIRPYGILIKEV